MCSTCGCGGAGEERETESGHGHAHAHGHDHDHDHAHDPAHGHSHGHVHVVRPVGAPLRIVELERDLLGKNDGLAAKNRLALRGSGTVALNLMSSPGSGKTTLLVRTLEHLRGALLVGVVEGDQETSLDAERIRSTGAPAVQVNTGSACHLDAAMVARAMHELPPLPGGVLFVENVGNLVCPAAFDLGETKRVVIASVTEGEDKPLKYPNMFARADLLVVTKSDLLPHLSFDLPLFLRRAAEVKPGLESIVVSAKTGEGLDAWYAWIHRIRAEVGAP